MQEYKEKIEIAKFFQPSAYHLDPFMQAPRQQGQQDDEKEAKGKKGLSSKLALEIFAERCLKSGYATVESTFVARKYGVSSKTVRDIWNRRTWADATRPMWTEEEKGSTEALEACKEKKRLANKKRKLSQMKQASDKEEATHDSDAHEDSKDMAEDEDEKGGSMQEGCSGSEASTQCERTSGKVLSSPAESGDVSNCKGSGSNSFPEGSSSPTSSFQSQSTSSSDARRSEHHGQQFKVQRRGSMRELQEALHRKNRSKPVIGQEKSVSSAEGKESFSDSGSNASCPSASSAGERSSANGDPEGKGRAGGEAAKHANGATLHKPSAAVWRALDETQEETMRKKQNMDIGALTSGNISGLLKQIMDQQNLILQQQQQILKKRIDLQGMIDGLSSHAESVLPVPQPNDLRSNRIGQPETIQFADHSHFGGFNSTMMERQPGCSGQLFGGIGHPGYQQGQTVTMGGWGQAAAYQQGQQNTSTLNQQSILQLLQAQLVGSLPPSTPYQN